MKIAIQRSWCGGAGARALAAPKRPRADIDRRAPHFRTGGYVIDFWGVGYRVAQLMGIEAAIREAGYQVQSIRSVGPDNQVRASVGVDAFRRATGADLPACRAGTWPPPSTPP